MSTLARLLDDYLMTQRALGFKLKTEGTGLKTFVSFMEQQRADYITANAALVWAQEPHSVQPVQWSRRLSFVRGFARYCSAFDARTEVPSSDLLPSMRVRCQQFFFTDDDIARLLQATLNLGPMDGLRRWTFHCLFGLFSVSGLRFCEARNLSVDDVDLVNSVLTIRSSKFGKSRLVPLHARAHSYATDHVFINDCGRPLSHDQAIDTFQRLLRKIGVADESVERKPHLHDLRHHFAIQTLLHWYHDGEDIERRLPVLSAYLGHVEIRNTYWYLSARPDMLNLARLRLEQYWGHTS